MLDYDAFFEQEFLNFKNEIEGFFKDGKRVFLTSSFQTQSIPLLHMISRLDKRIDVLLLDTGYLFPETHNFVDKVSATLKLNVKKVTSSLSFIDQVTSPGKFLFSEDTEKCCYINKVSPIQHAYKEYDVWISGIRADQSATRASKSRVEKNSDGVIRFHPMLNWTSKHIFYYRKKFDLPYHPLEDEGYLSIGCMPCTTKYCESNGNNERSGRWQGSKKTECGLHTQI